MKIKRIFALILILSLCIGAMPVYAADCPRLLALTFDDGPSTKYTPALLEGLALRRVKATFFLMGNSLTDPNDVIIEQNADVVRRMQAEGHQIANHSYSHPKLPELTAAELASELGKTNDALNRILGEQDYMLRPPYGAVNEAVCAAAGAPVILWNMDPGWDCGPGYTAEKIANYIERNAKDGDIILLHDFKGMADVDGALMAIDRLRAKGFEFVTVAEMLRLRGIEPKDGQVFSSIPAEAAREFDETDLSGHWAYGPLQKMRQHGLMQGVGGGKMDPEGTLTRAQMATLLHRAYGSPETAAPLSFADCQLNSWYSEAIAWCTEEGIFTGYPDGSFYPDQAITREQLYALGARILRIGSPLLTLRYADDDRISPWAQPSVAAMRSAGFYSENDKELFRPLMPATRAEAAEMVCFLIDKEVF